MIKSWIDQWKLVELSEYEDYVHRNYAGFRLSVRHIHGKYFWDAKRGGQCYWGNEQTLDAAKKAAEDSAWKAPL